MSKKDQFDGNEDEILESLNERNHTLSLNCFEITYHQTRGFEHTNNSEYLQEIIMNISLSNQYQRKIFLKSEVLNLIFSEIYQMKECKHISQVMIKSDTEIDFDQILKLISNIPSVKMINIEQPNLSKELLLIAEIISEKLPNLEELYLNDDKNNDDNRSRNKKYLDYEVACKYEGGNKKEEEEEEEVVVQNKLRNLNTTNIQGISFLLKLFPNIEVLELSFDEQNSRIKEDSKFIFELKELKELNMRFEGKISTEEVTSICWFLSQSNISKINLDFRSLSIEQELNLALEVRKMKHPEQFYLNDKNLFDLRKLYEYTRKKQFSVVILGCLGMSNKINNLLGYLNCEIEDLMKKEKDRKDLLLSSLKEILAPFQKMKLSSLSCPSISERPTTIYLEIIKFCRKCKFSLELGGNQRRIEKMVSF